MSDINRFCLVRHRPNLLGNASEVFEVCHVGHQHLARLVRLDVVETRQRVTESKTTHWHERIQRSDRFSNRIELP